MVTRYVNTDADPGGNGVNNNTTANTDYAYDSLSAWEAGEQGSALTEDHVCYFDGATIDTTQLDINGWTTNGYRITVTVEAANEHSIVWDTNLPRFEVTNDTNCIRIQENNVSIIGLQIRFIATTSGTRRGIYNDAPGNGTTVISHNIIRGSLSASADTGTGIYISPDVDNDNTITHCYNNIVYDVAFGLAVVRGIYFRNGRCIVYCNTVYNCAYGLDHSGASSHVVRSNISNCDAVDSNFVDYDGFTGGTYSDNLSTDATSPNTANRNETVTYEGESDTPRDLHLASGDTGAIGNGTELSADSDLAVTDDAEGDARDASTPDIGADEYVSSALTINVAETMNATEALD
jgi:hypothetical protein